MVSIKKNGRTKSYCKCKCDCGNECLVESHHIRNRPHPNCGCMTKYYRSLSNRESHIGEKYGKLTIIDEISEENSPTMAVCKCDCGNVTIKRRSEILVGKVSSCGCLHKETMINLLTKDFTGYISDSGVKIISRSAKQLLGKSGAWYWNCECPYCGKEFIALPANVIRGNVVSCGCQKQSKGECAIEEALNENKCFYKKQGTFEDCKHKARLKFDFVVYNNDNTVKCVIEYDGMQHEKPIEYFGGQEGFKIRKRCDTIKNIYCKINHIPMHRINYDLSYKNIKNKVNEILNP